MAFQRSVLTFAFMVRRQRGYTTDELKICKFAMSNFLQIIEGLGYWKLELRFQDSWVAWSIYAFWVLELWLKMRTLFGKKWNTLAVKILGDFILSLFFPLTNLVMNLPFSVHKSTCICLPTSLSFGAGGQLFFFPFPSIFLSLLEMGEWFSFFSSDLPLLWNGLIFFFTPFHPSFYS
jgi:hypothetical protein